MRLPPFEYLEPVNVKEALAMMNAHKGAVKIMAGGTSLVNHLKLRLLAPKYLLNIGKLKALETVEITDAQAVIGANTRLKTLAAMPLLNKKFKAIAEAALQVASPTIAGMATIGGNLLQDTRCLYYNQSHIVLSGLARCRKRGGKACLAVKGGKKCFSVYQGDLAPALIAFNARCVIEKKGASRTIPLTDLFTGDGISPFTIAADELLTKIIVPALQGRYGSSFRKLRLRGSIDYPLASAAACLAQGDDMKVTVCRVVIGASGAAPKVIVQASSAFAGNPLSGLDLDAVAQMSYKQAEGVDNLQMPGSYRRDMAGVLAKRAVQAALDEIKGGM